MNVGSMYPTYRPKVSMSCLTAMTTDELRTFYTSLTREYTTIERDLEQILANGQTMEDVWVLAFHTRDVRGGKGEKLLFYTMLQVLLTRVSESRMKTLLSLVPEYGSYNDLLHIANLCSNPSVTKCIFQICSETLLEDDCRINTKPSLLAKWLPREGSKWDNTPCSAKRLAEYFYPYIANNSHRMKLYRQRITALNRSLKTVEIDMCGNTWSSILPKNVPKQCLKRNKYAFLNVKDRGLRYPHSKDRMTCRQTFIEHFQQDAVITPKYVERSLRDVLDDPRYFRVREAFL